MNADVKRQWTAALRSGQYEQGEDYLVSLEGAPKFCCLGVLCDLAEQAGVVTGVNYITPSGSEDGTLVKVYDKDPDGSPEYLVLPPVVQEWAGLDHSNPIINNESLSIYNDEGNSFEFIAKLIDEHL